MPPKAVELRPDRRKLKTTFDGYKLSLDPLPVLKYDIPRPERVVTSDRQFSFLHAELFGLHNHLHRDPWHQNTAYFIDSTWTLQKVIYDGDTGKVRPFIPVMKLLKPNTVADERYPLSLEFVSDRLAVLADGHGTLVIIETGQRANSDEFKAKQRFQPVDAPFVIRSAQFTEEEKTISVILTQVQQAAEHFETIAHWVKLKCCESIWSILDTKILKTRSSLHYSALEESGEAVLLATDYPVDFLSNLDRKKEEFELTEKEDTEKMEKEPVYTWSQTDEDVTVNFDRKEGGNKQDYEVRVTLEDITVKYKSQILLSGKLFAPIDVDTATWTMQNEFLQVLLMKQTAITWPFLVPGGPDEQDGTSEAGPSIYATNEEDDDVVTDQDKENYLSRLTWLDEETTHQVYLGTTQPLFSVVAQPGLPKAVALKHDVDACIWQPGKEFAMSHEDTIDAFGYILASKQQRKFVSCSPDAAYVVVAEAERHIFIYKKGYHGSNLRNRTGVPVNIGQQKLVILEGLGEVIGISAENDVTLLLTPNYLVCLQLKIEE